MEREHVDGESNPLAIKIARIAAQIAKVPKDGHNSFHHYDYATDTAIVEAVREYMNPEHVAIFPSLVTGSVKMQPIGEKGEMLTTLEMQFKVIDGDSGVFELCNYPGAGTDKLDKGVYKAVTGATKYFLQKLFNIPTGDDPEQEKDIDNTAPRTPAGNQTQAEKVAAVKARQQANAAKQPDAAVMQTELPPAKPPTAVNASVRVAGITVKDGENSRGPWKLYTVTFDKSVMSDTGVATKSASTYHESVAMQAYGFIDTKTPVVVTVSTKKNDRGFNNHTLEAIVAA